MTWLVFISHAFNPLIMTIGLGILRSEYLRDKKVRVTTVIGLIISSLMIYILWLGFHYGITFIGGTDFNFMHFIGVGQGIQYFLPFIISAAVLINESVIRPLIKTEAFLTANDGFLVLMILVGSYTLLVNYMAWISS